MIFSENGCVIQKDLDTIALQNTSLNFLKRCGRVARFGQYHQRYHFRVAGFRTAILLQIVHLHESNTGGVVHTTHNRGVIACWQVCNDRRLTSLCRSMPAVLDRANLASVDDPANYRGLPVIIRRNQRPSAVVQFQCRIGQGIRNVKWRRTQLGTNRTDNHRL